MRIAFVMPSQPLLDERQIHVAVITEHFGDAATISIPFCGVHGDILGAYQLDEHIPRHVSIRHCHFWRINTGKAQSESLTSGG